MDFSKYLTADPGEGNGYPNWQYRFPNGHTASVIVDHPKRPFRFEVLSSDPKDASVGGVRADLTSAEVESKLARVASLDAVVEAAV